jgi:methyl-accepting chemotaxis protein
MANATRTGRRYPLAIVLTVTLAIAAGGPALLLGFGAARRALADTTTARERERELITGAVAQRIESWFGASLQGTSTIALLGGMRGISTPGALNEDIARFRALIQGAPGCLLVDEQGIGRSSDPATSIGRNYADRVYLQVAQRTRKPTLSSVLTSRTMKGTNTIVTAVPVVDDDAVIATAACAMDLNVLQRSVDLLLAAQPSIRVAIVDEEAAAKGSDIEPDEPRVFVLHPLKQAGADGAVHYPARGRAPASVTLARELGVDDAEAVGALFAPLAPGESRFGYDWANMPVRVTATPFHTKTATWTIYTIEDADELTSTARAAILQVSIALLVALVLAAAVGALLARWIVRPFPDLVRFAGAAAAGDFAARPPVARELEIAEVASLSSSLLDAFSLIRSSIESLATTSRGIDDATERLQRATIAVDDGSSRAQGAAERAAVALSSIRTGTSDVVSRARVLSTEASEARSVINDVVIANDSVHGSIVQMLKAVNAAALSVDEQAEQARANAAVQNDVTKALQRTAAVVDDTRGSFTAIAEASSSATSLATEVSNAAERGAAAIRKAMKGIIDTGDATAAAGAAIRVLEDRLGDVARIAIVIDGISETTRLLSLNASILAAQAGEAGRGFQIVAEEVKRLAEQTANATREIERLLQSVREASRQALVTVAGNAIRIQSGESLSAEAEAALDRIQSSATAAIERTRDITTITSRESNAVRQSVQEIHDISRQVQGVAKATLVQASGATEIARRTRSSEADTAAAAEAALAQTRRLDELARAVRAMLDVATALDEAFERQRREMGAADDAASAVFGAAASQRAALKEFSAVVQALTKRSDALRFATSQWVTDANTDKQ